MLSGIPTKNYIVESYQCEHIEISSCIYLHMQNFFRSRGQQTTSQISLNDYFCIAYKLRIILHMNIYNLFGDRKH